MIRAIISDIDGVIIGNKKGFNFPKPNPEVMHALKTLNQKGIPVILCTGKASYVIENIIWEAHLDNPHIGDGGTLIFNPIKKEIIRKHTLETKLVQEIIKACVEKKIHISVNTLTDTFVDASHNPEITEKRSGVMEKQILVSPSLEKHVEELEVIKMLATVRTAEEIEEIKKIIGPYLDRINLLWTSHPMTGDWRYALVTLKGITKLSAVREVVDSMGLSFPEILGVGDTTGDWVFMKECGNVAVVGNTSLALQEEAKTKGDGNYFLAPSVDENGFLEILKYFKLR
ncbi:MAG: HAD family hydrolase [Candidatus Levyibacteriota bacterium]